ncbi:protein phosphatase 1 regulatory subunit 12A-like isoform X4 [Lytechinus variegatus]|uniref:protein phosphatase 1 regulatory subunit 12A-like isoform X4 n=1 Tax=Lytechinus variegatus TaxID=7654 RepID=UPI001BB0EAFA|nr:protein phosphatase 1 regulatory subunit 12A-like isoform X4 [Lytechinus variegatus]
MADGEDSSAGGKPKSALMRRHEQLQRWKDSEFDREPAERNAKKAKVKFAAGCVFLAACASEDLDEIEALMKRGADINYANIDGLTALHQAVIDEKIDMVEYLLEHGADIEAQDNEGWTALHAAASCGFEDIASYLIENGANLVACNNEGELPMDLAEEEDMEEFLQDEMDKQDLDVDQARTEEHDKMLEDAKQWLNSKQVKDRRHPKTGATSLHVASAKGYIKVMELLIQAGVDVNAKDNDGWTPLHAASHWGHKDACEVLVKAMCDMDAKNRLNHTAFDLADEEILKWLEELKKKQASMKKDEPTAPRIDTKVPPPLKRRQRLSSSGSGRPSRGSRRYSDAITSDEEIEKALRLLRKYQANQDKPEQPRRSSVTRISVPDRNMLLHQDMAKERKELEKKMHGGDKVKKTMESSSSSEEESESEEESSEEESEEEKNSDKNPTPVRRPLEVNSRLGRPTITPQPSAPSKKEMPSFSPKPLAPQQAQVKLPPPKQEKKQEEEVPAWRTGLRKTTSSSTVPEPKKTETQADKLARSASTPRIPTSKPETKPPAPWENQRVSRPAPPSSTKTVEPEPSREVILPSPRGSGRRRIAAEIITDQDRTEPARDRTIRDRSVPSAITTPSTTNDTTSTTCNNNTPVGSSATTTIPPSRRSIMTPSKEEESETQRKARAKRERSSRRSTQGVSAEDIESAVSTLKNSEPKTQDNRVSENNKQETPRLRPRISASTVENKDDKPEEPQTMTFVARPSRSTTSDSSSTPTATARLGRSNRDDKSATDEAKERAKEREKEQDALKKNSTSNTALSRRRPREKRRDTGVIHPVAEEDEDDDEEEEEDPLKSRRPSPLYSSYTTDRSSRPSSTSSVGSRYGDSSSVLDRSRGGTDRNQTSTRSTTGQSCPSCKKLFEEKDALISKLQGEVKQKDQEIAELKSQSDRRSDSRSGDSDKRERRGLERRISELEEELKAMEQLKSDNQRLKDENGALVRVISKLSK